MLTKVIGPVQNITMTSTAQTVYVTTYETGTLFDVQNQPLPAYKIRVSTGAQPAFISFSGNTATSTASILVPANTVEHFKLEQTYTLTTSTAFGSYGQVMKVMNSTTVSVLQAGTAGVVCIAAVA